MEGKGREGQIAQGTLGKKGAALSFISAFFLALFVFTIAGIMPGGKAVSWNTDTMDQMAAFYAMLARHLKSGGSLFYSWNTSIGQNTALLYALCSYSPVLLLYMLIPDIYAATMISMIVKIALSSMFFYIFLEYGLCWKGKWNVFFSLCYAFCGFMLEYLMAFNLSDALYFLPLIMYAIMRSIRTERFLFLSLVYALSFINELYMAFLTGLFSAAALLVIFYLKDGKEFIKKNLKYLIKYFFCVLAAVLMSMCLLFPAIMCYFSYNGFNSLMNVEHIGITDLLYSFFFGRPTSLRTNIPFLYCGSPVILLLPFYFIDSSISKRERIVSIASVLLMAVSLYLDPLYLFLHVFNRPDGFTVRYAFVFVFVMVILAAREVYKGNESVKKMGKARVAVYFLIMLSVALSLILLHDNIGEEADGKGVFFALIGNLVLLPLWGGVAFAALYGRNKKISVTLAYTLLLAELGVQFYFNACEYGLLPASQINEKKAQMDSFAAGLNDAGDPGEQVYRAYAAAYPGDNQNAAYGIMGIGQFSSSNYAGINKLMKRFGNPVSGVSYSQAGATDLSDMIFGVRYRGRLAEGRADGEAVFEEYEYALPIGFMCSDHILGDIIYNGDPFEYQNSVISAMCGEKTDVYERAEVYGYEPYMLTYQKTEDGYSIRNTDDPQYGNILFGIPEAGYDHAYAYFRIFPYSGKVEEKVIPGDMATDVALFSTDDRKGNGSRFNIVIEDSIMEMTKDGNAFVINLADYEPAGKSFDYNEQYFYYQNEEMLKRASDILYPGGWKVMEWKDIYIKAQVLAEPDRNVLFMSIPYDKGWKAYSDGAGIIPEAVLDGSLMALRLTPGEHEIVLEYEAPGEKAGLIMSAAGILILMFMTFFCGIKKNTNDEL